MGLISRMYITEDEAREKLKASRNIFHKLVEAGRIRKGNDESGCFSVMYNREDIERLQRTILNPFKSQNKISRAKQYRRTIIITLKITDELPKNLFQFEKRLAIYKIRSQKKRRSDPEDSLDIIIETTLFFHLRAVRAAAERYFSGFLISFRISSEQKKV